jgi:hypothetical protein
MARRTPTPKTIDVQSSLPTLRDALARQGTLKRSDLTKAGVPKVQHEEAMAALVRGGAERTKVGVRLELASQLRALLAEKRLLPRAKLGKAARGASQAEAKRAADRLVAGGEAVVVLRGKAEFLATKAEDLLTRDQLIRLAEVGALARKATTRAGLGLLRDDLRSQLFDIFTAAPARHADGARDLESQVLAGLRHAAREPLGLAFVPEVVRQLSAAGVSAVHEVLLRLARAQQIELQPESGVGRLTADELSLCPPGPQGSRLSWARVLHQG